jgi:hypothetical protein
MNVNFLWLAKQSSKKHRETPKAGPHKAQAVAAKNLRPTTRRRNAVPSIAWMMLPSVIASLLLICSICGCVGIGHNRLADYQAEGQVVNNVYTSPRQSFRFRLPWISADATLRDEKPTPNSILVTIKDDLCREFLVSEQSGYLGTESLQSWVDAHVVKDLTRLGFEVRSQALTTRNGTAIALRYRAPAAVPCNVAANRESVASKFDADVGWYVYHRDGMFYRLIYIIGIGPGTPSLWYINREPVDEVLAQFAEGFEILYGRER